MSETEYHEFHEAEVTRFESSLDGKRITLEAVDVFVDGVNTKCRIEAQNVKEILRDDVAVNHVILEANSSEILVVRGDRSPLFLLVQWEDFQQKVSYTRSYEIWCDDFHITNLGPHVEE